MKEIKFQRNACIILVVASIITGIAFIFDVISNGLNISCMAALLYLIVSAVERYSKYKLIKNKYNKSVEN